MFPFNYIPEDISPTIRKLLIGLISVQFIAFVILMLTLLYEFCTTKRNKTGEIKNKKEEINNKKEEPKENNKKEENNNKEKLKGD